MTATLDDVTSRKKMTEPTAAKQAAEELVRRAREQGISLTGPDGLFKQLSSPSKATPTGSETETSAASPLPSACLSPEGTDADNHRAMGGVVEVELFQALARGEPGGADAAFAAVRVAGGGLALQAGDQ